MFTPVKVVIVDDSEVIAVRLAQMLRDQPGIELMGHAKGVHEGKALCLQHCPHLVFLDIKMPDGNGFELLDYLKQQSAQTAVVMLSNFSGNQYRERGNQLGADYFLDKTNEFEKIPDIVEKVVAQNHHG